MKNKLLLISLFSTISLYKGNAALHVLLRNRQVKHEFRVRDGGHTWVYWRTGIVDGLKFIGDSFNR